MRATRESAGKGVSAARTASAAEARAQPVPLRYWALWWTTLGGAVVVFYVVLTPVWIGLRALAWLAELDARRRRRRAGRKSWRRSTAS